MENYNWSKTLLSVYRYLPRVTYALDKIVKTRAYNSYYVSSNNVAFNDVMNVANTILNLTDRKITLINIKLIVEKCLYQIDKKMARILVLKFIDGKKSVEIADKFNVCLRTIFRKINTALESFSKALCRNGYDDGALYNLLKNEKWILSTYQKQKTDLNKADNFEDACLLHTEIKNNIILEFKKVSSF